MCLVAGFYCNMFKKKKITTAKDVDYGRVSMDSRSRV